jgi:hypothetical protein
MADPKPVINIGKLLEKQDLEFAGTDEAGNYLVTDLEGRTGKFNVDRFLKAKNIDRNKIDISFNTPDMPMDSSPVELTDRLKLSVGNKAGSLEYLKQKFDNVKYNPEGELVVKKAGVWHRVDPESMGSNPWEMTKEIVGDLADVAPTIGLVGASIGAGVATGGVATGFQAAGATLSGTAALALNAGGQAAAGGITESIRTSLGRAVGTYKATPEEQMSDIGMEMLLNFGGQYVGAGVAAVGKRGVGMLSKAAKSLSKANPEGQGIIASVVGPVVGGADNVDRLLKNPEVVTKHLDEAITVGKSESEAVQHLVQGQIDDLVKVADQAPDALSKQLNQNIGKLMAQAPDQFEPAINDSRKLLLANMLKDGLLRVEDKVGRRIGGNMVRPAILDPEVLMTKNLDDLNIRMYSFDELGRAGQRTGFPNKFGNSKDAYDMAADMYTTIFRNKLKPQTGKAGVRQLMEFKEAIASKTWELMNNASEKGLGFAQSFFANADSVLDKQVNNTFAKNGMLNSWTTVNAEYSATKSLLNPLIAARKKAIKTNAEIAFQPELNRILSNGAGNLASKNSLKGAVSLINNPVVTQSFENIFDRNAAKAFVPKFGTYAKAAGAASIGSAVSLNPVTALAFAGSAVGTSPRMVGRMLAKVPQAGDAIEIGFKKLDFLKKVGPNKMPDLVNNPGLLNSFLQTGAEAMQLKEQVKGSLLNGAMQAAQPVTGPAQFLQQQKGKGR